MWLLFVFRVVVSRREECAFFFFAHLRPRQLGNNQRGPRRVDPLNGNCGFVCGETNSDQCGSCFLPAEVVPTWMRNYGPRGRGLRPFLRTCFPHFGSPQAACILNPFSRSLRAGIFSAHHAGSVPCWPPPHHKFIRSVLRIMVLFGYPPF